MDTPSQNVLCFVNQQPPALHIRVVLLRTPCMALHAVLRLVGHADPAAQRALVQGDGAAQQGEVRRCAQANGADGVAQRAGAATPNERSVPPVRPLQDDNQGPAHLVEPTPVNAILSDPQRDRAQCRTLVGAAR